MGACNRDLKYSGAGPIDLDKVNKLFLVEHFNHCSLIEVSDNVWGWERRVDRD